MMKMKLPIKIKTKDIQNDVKWNDTYAKELHYPLRKKFRKRRVFSPGIDIFWAADLADMKRYSRKNKGYKYLLVCIDIFSKYGFVKPMKNKTAAETTRCFKEIFEESGRIAHAIWIDKGSEFLNRTLQNFLKEHNSRLYNSENELKSCVVERFIRTLKTDMFRMFTASRTREYISKLDGLVSRYNSRVHSSIKCTPEEASMPYNWQFVYNNLYPPLKKAKKPIFDIGDRVRIARKKALFEKGFEPNYTEQIFEVDSIEDTNPVTYKLKDLNNQQIRGTFYRQNLVKTTQDIYFIEKILARRVKNGVKQIKVRWSSYSSEFDSWIEERTVLDTSDKNEDDLQNINIADDRLTSDVDEDSDG